MKKGIRRTLIAAPVVLIIALVVIYISLGSIVRAAAREVLPRVTGTECDIKNVSIDLIGGRASIGGLLIGNPEGYKTDSAFEMSNVTVTFSLASVFSDTVKIQEILIEDPKVTYEMGLGGSNLGDIKKNAEKLAGDKPAEEEAKEGKRVEIDRFLMRGAKVRVASKDMGLLNATVPLPDIEIKDIGKEKDDELTVSEAAGRIITEIASVTDRAVRASDQVVAELKGLGQDIENLGRGVLEGGGKIIEEGGKIIDGVKGLIK